MKPIIFLSCLIIGLINKAHTACLCGFGEGTDVCGDEGGVGSGGSSGCAPMVVRPAPNPRIPFITGSGVLKPLRPVGDVCSCRHTVVVPANVPRPSCKRCGTPNIYVPVPDVESPEQIVYPVPTGTGASGVPVDAVSLGIVYAQSQRSCGQFADDRLWYGPGKLPIDQPILKPSKSRLPESNLHQIKGVPLELTPIPCHRPVAKSLDDEAYDDYIIEEERRAEQTQEERRVPQFTYDELGYRVVIPGQPQFVAVQGNAPEEETPDEVEIDDIGDFSGGTYKCKDGYRPGNIIVKSIPQREIYVPAPSIPISCPEEADDNVYPVYPNPNPIYPGPGQGVVYEPYPCDS